MELILNTSYKAISGEVGGVLMPGTPCLVIRTQGCNLRCEYCDAVETQIKTTPCCVETSDLVSLCMDNRLIPLLTGGEPLLQYDSSLDFMKKCNECSDGVAYSPYPVQIETNGTLTLEEVVELRNTYVVMDLKYDELSSKYIGTITKNIFLLRPRDYLKGIARSLDDVVEVINAMMYYRRHGCKARFAVSLILKDGVPLTPQEMERYLSIVYNYGSQVTINFQLHKLLNLP